MGYILLIIVEVISVVLITSINHPRTPVQNNFSNVLGVQIAQDAAPIGTTQTDQAQPAPDTSQSAPQDQRPLPSDMTTNNNPTDQSAPTPTPSDQTNQTLDESPSPILQTESSPTDQHSATEVPIPQDTSSPANSTEIPNTEAPEELPNHTSQTEEQLQFNTQLTVAINSTDLSISPDYVSDSSLKTAQNQDQILNSQTAPHDQVTSLIKFTQDNTKSIDNLSQANDYASSDFVAQRISNQVTQAQQIIQNLPSGEAKITKNQLLNVCQSTDEILRVSELSVPNDVEQDMEIARGVCDSLNR